jgi:hypothetical protein
MWLLIGIAPEGRGFDFGAGGSASWAMIDGLLHVRSAIGNKVAELGALPPQSPARLLMWELATEPACCG